jgi:hypothetical protein
MLSELNQDQLRALFRAVETAPPPLPGSFGFKGISSILQSQGVITPLAQDIEFALTSERFDLATLRSAIGFALSQKLAAIQGLCAGAAVFAAILSGATFLFSALSGGRTYVVFFGGMVAGTGGAAHFSREKRLYQGKRADLQTVEQHCETDVRSASPDLY